jgi:uncharacterized protein (TIGR02145 family)/uncharacterized repeat protein (TIGR02543 family)
MRFWAIFTAAAAFAGLFSMAAGQGPLTVDVTPAGSGRVTRDLNQIAYPEGTAVNLAAEPKPGYRFKNWTGSATGTERVIRIVTTGHMKVTAVFEKISYIPLADARDGKTYRAIKIGGQTWMAENLNYQTDDSWCYDNKPDNCEKYGRLYSWDAAMRACPDGWHLPSHDEWNALVNTTGGEDAATGLKSKSPDWDGEDAYWFSALPGGLLLPGPGGSSDLGSSGRWWAAKEHSSSLARYRYMRSGDAKVGEGAGFKRYGSSARCVQDGPDEAVNKSQ